MRENEKKISKKINRKNVKLKYEQFLLRKGVLKDRLGDTNERRNRENSLIFS